MTADDPCEHCGGEAQRARQAADQLADVLLALEGVDRNPLLDDELRALLDAKDTVGDICRRLRKDARAIDDS